MTAEMFGFVILHYMAFKMTCECVDLLKKNFLDKNMHIVIVDNASKNGSGKKLLSRYKGCNKISVILNKENEGFARGNNIGYEYLKYNFDCDYIIAINNDVMINDGLFCDKISAIYSRNHFDVLGPDIFCPKGYRKHQNPFSLHNFSSLQNLENHYSKLKKNYAHFDFFFLKSVFSAKIKSIEIFKNVYRFAKYSILKKERVDYTREYINPVLHGSCLIFSKDFIKKREYAFYPKTFLYLEENILQYEIMKSARENDKGRVVLLYSPEISVLHLEDVSTNQVLKGNYEKTKFKLEKND